MKQLYVLVALTLIASAIAAALKKGAEGKSKEEVWPFYPKRLLSNPEQVLYHRLIRALPDHLIFAQVQLSRFLGVKRGHNFQAWNNRINRMSADFLVCSKDSAVLVVIELDDATHQRKSRQEADAKKEKVLEAAGLRLVRWNVKSIPDEATIRRELG